VPEKVWTTDTTLDEAQVREFAESLGIPPLIARLLLQRGFTTGDSARDFMRPQVGDLSDPFEYSGMDIAVKRIGEAIERNERIMISGDYDVDGVTATALLKEALVNCDAIVTTYIPDRFQDGYGLSTRSIEHAREIGAQLIVTVDCGTNDVAPITLAKSHGIDCIVCDHHYPDPPFPPAVVILNPKITDSSAPFIDFSAVGVAFKLAQALYEKLRGARECADSLLDLVAVGTVADIVPLRGENRLLVSRGLERLNASPRPGIAALLESAGFQSPKQVGTAQILFTIAPRINAAGRMVHAAPAVELMTTTEIDVARKLAAQLEDTNKQRRATEETIMEEAEADLFAHLKPETDRAIVLAGDGWHEGVIGIVASRLMNKYHRPVVMIAIRNGMGRGSSRSVHAFNLIEALTACDDHLERYGGHPMAAGLTINRDQIPEFRNKFLAVADQQLADAKMQPTVPIDSWTRFDEIDNRMVKLLKMFEPFGPCNPRPIFASENVQVVGSPQIVGTNHLKFKARQAGQIFDAIGFGMGDVLSRLPIPPDTMKMAYHIDENTWNGRTTTQLQVKDIQEGSTT
jgi:single-stranded-DNA-specific exonuclease